MAGIAKYKVFLIHKNTTKYDVTSAVTKLTLNESDGEIAQRVELTLYNKSVLAYLSGAKMLSGIVSIRDRVIIYADDGERNEEVFRGFVWARGYKSGKKKELSVTCYDNLIYFQESEDYKYFSAGYSTKSICGKICGDWKVTLKYHYKSITHPKLPLRGTLADIFITDLLEEVRKKTGVRYVMRSEKDIVQIYTVGLNNPVYKLLRNEGGNTIDTQSNKTMQGMVTRVVILGKEDKEDRASIEAAVDGDSYTFGILQKVLSVSSGTDLAEVKEEAQELIDEKGAPIETFSVTAVDIPWVRKGDRVYVSAGDMVGYFIVTSITHYAMDKTMILEAVRHNERY